VFNEQQLAAIQHREGPAIVLAAAGSGKSTLIVGRIKELIESGVKPGRILTITFSKASVEDLKKKCDKLNLTGVEIRSFHSLGFWIVRTEVEHLRLLPLSLHYKKGVKVFTENSQGFFMRKFIKDNDYKVDFGSALGVIGMFKRNLITVEEVGRYLAEHYWENAPMWLHIYEAYEAFKREQNSIDFDDMIFIAVKLLGIEGIRKKWQTFFDYMMVDEAQDNSLMQFQLPQALAGEENNIMIVGDDFQAIYSFNGSRVEQFLNFPNLSPKTQVYLLEKNYRSGEPILELGNKLVRYMDNPFQKQVQATRNGQGASINYQQYIDSEEEGLGIVEQIMMSSEDTPYEDMLCLYRTHAQSRAIEDALIRSRIPYVIVGGISFYQRKEVKDVLSMLMIAYDSRKYEDHIARVVNISSNDFPYPTRRLGKEFIAEMKAYAKKEGVSYAEALSGMRLTDFQRKGVRDFSAFLGMLRKEETLAKQIEVFLDKGYLRYVRNELGLQDDESCDRIEMINELKYFVSLYPDPEELFSYVEQIWDGSQSKDEGVRLMTLHKSKGLEAHTVFLPGLNQGILPHKNAGRLQKGEPSGSLEEERRLCYVGVTRATHKLYISRFRCKEEKVFAPSYFLKEMGLIEY